MTPEEHRAAQTAEGRSDAHDVSPADQLRAAARLIERVLIRLDVTEEKCAGCGGKHFTNKNHARIYEQYTDAPIKLRHAANVLDGAGSISMKLPPSARQARLAHEARRR